MNSRFSENGIPGSKVIRDFYLVSPSFQFNLFLISLIHTKIKNQFPKTLSSSNHPEQRVNHKKCLSFAW